VQSRVSTCERRPGCRDKRLGRKYVLDASDRGIRKRIAHFNGPDASAAANVNDFKRLVVWKDGVRQPSI
jgi:hypothetical protein